MPMSRRAALKAARTEMKNYVKSRKSELIAKRGSLYLFPDCIVNITGPTVGNVQAASSWKPLTGLTARLETSGGIAGVGGLGRAVLVSGWQRKVDTRELAIVLTGPDWEWSVDVRANATVYLKMARQFVAQVNSTAWSQVGAL